jgi:diguanylate cyclase (GGDEF)-like protein/PAS domain S-box-containing protein
MLNKFFKGILGHFLLRAIVIQAVAGVVLLTVFFITFDRTANELAAEQGHTLANSTLAATSDAVFAEDYSAVIDYSLNVMKATPNILSMVFSKRNGEELIVSGKKWELKKQSLPYYSNNFEEKYNNLYPYSMEYAGHAGLAFTDSFNFSQPIYIAGKDWGVLTISFSTETYQSSIRNFYHIVIAITSGSIILSLLLFYLSSKRIRNEIQSFGDVATKLSEGELDTKADESAIGEIGGLATAVNRMSVSLKEKSRRIAQLVNIVEQTNDAFLLFDDSKHIIFANQALMDFTGFPPSHFVGMHIEEFASKKYLGMSELLAEFDIAVKGSQMLARHDVVMVNNDGIRINLEVRLELIKDDEMSIGSLLIVLSNIDERIHTENMMRELNLDLSATLKAIPDLLFEMDGDGKYINLWAHNPELLAAQRDALIGHTVQEALPLEAANTVIAALGEAEKKGVSHGQVIKLNLPQGETWFELSTALKSSSISNGNRFIVLSRDVTERKHAEQQLRIAATAFESQEGMLVTDNNGFILRVNRAFTTITGYEATEVLGKNPRVLGSGRHDAAFFSAMYKSIESIGSWEGEIWNKRKNGEEYPQRLVITAVKDSNGNLMNYVASFTDITLSKAAAEKIELLAFYDPLTGLPNRRLLVDRLQQALASSARSGKEGAVLFIDLDNFKVLNDTLGHDIGDMLLKQVAQRLTTCVREGDTVARLGGDEYVVMLEDLSENTLEAAEQTVSIGNKILNTLNQPYSLGKNPYLNTPSIGAAIFNNNKSIEDILRQADKIGRAHV